MTTLCDEMQAQDSILAMARHEDDVLRGTVDPQTAMRNVATALLKYTEVKRSQNGRGKCSTYAANADTIAQTARQLAEMVMTADGKAKEG